MIKDKPVTSQDWRKACPICGENGEDKLILQMFENGQKINIEPPKGNSISLIGLILFQNRYQQKPFRNSKLLAASSELLKHTDVPSIDDDPIDKINPTRK